MQYVELFRKYMGSGLIIGWFLLSIVYLFLKEKRKQRRILFIYVPTVLLLLFFNPLFAGLVYSFEDMNYPVYWRILWLLPVTMTIAYTVVSICGTIKGRIRIFAAFFMMLLIMISGSFIYQNEGFVKAENIYHMPQTVVDICDAIKIEGREVMALFPDELLVYVRQYSPVVCMPYGREIYELDNNELRTLMQERIIDAKKLAELSKGYLCHYLILPKNKILKGSLFDYGYILFDTIDEYVIYKDTTMNYELWD